MEDLVGLQMLEILKPLGHITRWFTFVYIAFHPIKGSQKTGLTPLASIDQRTKQNLNQTVRLFFGDIEPSAAPGKGALS